MAADTRGTTLGLYLSPEVILAVFVRVTRGKPRAAVVGTTPTPRGSMDGTNVRDPARLGQAIRSLLKSLKSRASSASVVLPPTASALRAFRLPDVPERERRALVRGELETSGALPLGAGAFDFVWSRAPEEEERTEADVFAFYTDDAVVDGVREALRAAGLRLDRIEPYSVAAMRGYLHTREAAEPLALLCPSETLSDLCMHDGNGIRYLRRIPGGWDEMRYGSTATVVRPEPEGPGPTPLAGAEEGTPSEETIVAAPFAPPRDASFRGFLASEVARSFAFYSREYKDADVPRSLVILAARRYARDIAETLGASVPIPVVTEDASELLDLPEPDEGEMGVLGLLAALGVCLGDNASPIPVVDTSRQEAVAISRRQAPNMLLMGMAGSTVWMIASIVAAVFLSFMQMRTEVEHNLVTRELQEEWERHAAPKRNQEVFAEARKAQQMVAVPGPTILAALAAAYRPGIGLTSVKVSEGKKVVIEGTAVSPESMQAFADSLAKTQALGVPSFDMMHQDRDDRFTFRIIGSYAGLTPEGAKTDSG